MGFLQQASSALTPQSTYTAQVPQIQQQQLIPQINQSQAAIAQNQGNQNALASQLLQQSQGQGPNLADLQLKAATDRQMQQQAGAVASQKGISPALAQRQIAEQGAQAQQQAAQASGQMRAQQQLASQGQLGGLYGQIGGQQLQNQGILQGAQQAQNGALTQGTLGAENVNAGIAAGNTSALQKTQSGLVSGVGGALGGLGAMAMAHGGSVPMYADGGFASSGPAIGGPQSMLGQSLSAPQSSSQGDIPTFNGGYKPGNDSGSGGGGGDTASTIAKLAPLALMAAKGGRVPKDFRTGGHVPGQAKVKGDSLKNDTVPAVVSPGEIVLPRSVTQSKDPTGNAAKFVAAVLAHKGKKK